MFVFKKVVDESRSFLWGEEKITTKIVVIVTDCGTPQLTRVFNTRIKGDASSRMKVFKNLFKSIKNEVFEEALISEYPRLIVKFVNNKGFLVDKKEYWIESK